MQIEGHELENPGAGPQLAARPQAFGDQPAAGAEVSLFSAEDYPAMQGPC